MLCVPGTQDEVEGLPVPILPALPAVPPLPSTASCPQPPDNNITCKHDPTPSYQWGGTCRVTCLNPLDYTFITGVDEKYQTGCSADGVEVCARVRVHGTWTPRGRTECQWWGEQGHMRSHS